MLECLPIENIAEESADSDYKVIVFDVLDSLAVVNKTMKMKLQSFSEFVSTFLQKVKARRTKICRSSRNFRSLH